LLANTTVTTSLDSAGAVQIASSAEPAVAVASLAAVGAKPRNTYSGGGMKGFVLDLPNQVDEDEVVNKLVAQQDVMRVVPDTWVGIAAATGVHFLIEQLLCMTHQHYNDSYFMQFVAITAVSKSF
jgi:ABC-type amino acid transport substrate-binding protein